MLDLNANKLIDKVASHQERGIRQMIQFKPRVTWLPVVMMVSFDSGTRIYIPWVNLSTDMKANLFAICATTASANNSIQQGMISTRSVQWDVHSHQMI